MNPSASRRSRLLFFAGCAVIFLLVLAVYWPALHGGFIWDDDGHVTRMDLRGLPGLWRIWFEVGATQQYYPVLHSAFWVEHRLWGDAAVGYHLVNVALHATSACLFAVILRRLRVPGAFFAALIFAVHPVCVESVAWISEQKNTLSTVFYLLAALTYLKWVGTGGPPVRIERGTEHKPADADGQAARPYLRRWTLYLLATLLFILALLSKSVTATLPAALLVVLWWQQGRLSWKRDIVPLLPWFAIGLAAGLFTAWVERRYIGAQGAAFALTFLQRVLLAGRVIWFYLGKLFWPANLIFIYPHWQINAGAVWAYLFPAGAALLAAALWLIRKRTRAPLAALLFFVGSLFPALGFFNVYPFVFSYVADHFQYLACLGMIALVAGVWGKRESPPASRLAGLRRASQAIIAAAMIAWLAVLTWRQCRQYRDVETLYQTTLERNPESWLAQDNLGVVLAREDRLPEAIAHYQAALRLNPNFPETYNNFGNAMAHLGRWSEATSAYAQAVRLRPNFSEAEYNWGNALSDAGQYAEAEFHYGNALRLRADYPEAQYRLANALANAGQLPEAIACYRAAVRLRPAYAEARANLGLALNNIGRIPEALAELNEAVRLRPDYPEAHAYLGFALAGAGRLPEAVGEYRQALRLRPNDADTHYQLGAALRRLGEGREASAEFATADRLSAARSGR